MPNSINIKQIQGAYSRNDYIGLFSTDVNCIEEKILQLIEKTSQSLFLELADDLNEPIEINDIRKQAADYIIRKAKKDGLISENYNYESAKNLQIIISTITHLKTLSKIKITESKMTITKEIAEPFLESYKKQLEKAIIIEKNFPNAKSNKSKAFKARKIILQKIENYTDAIKLIESENSDTMVNLIFPPVNILGDFTSAEALQITDLESCPELSKIKNCLLDVQESKKLLLQSISELDENYYSENTLSYIINAQEKNLLLDVVYGLANNIILKFDNCIWEMPLNKNNLGIIERFLTLYDFIALKEKTNPEIEKIRQFMETRNPEQYRQLLKESLIVEKYNLSQKAHTDTTAKKTKLTKNEVKFLYLFDKIIDKELTGSSSEILFLSNKLENSLGNHDWNEKLSLISKDPKNRLNKKYKNTTNELKYLCFKTRYYDLSSGILTKCEKALAIIQTGERLQKNAQLTMFEFGRLTDLAKLKPLMDKYNKAGLLSKSAKLQRLFDQVNQANRLITKIQQSVLDEKITYESGDILFVDFNKIIPFKGEHPGRETAFTHTFISKYAHVSQIYKDPVSGIPNLSEVNASWQSGMMKLPNIATGQIFKIDVSKLIPAEKLEQLEGLYKNKNMDFKIEVQKLYQQNFQKLHVKSDKLFSSIQNNKSRRLHAGLANFGLYGGHTRTKDTGREKVHAKMYALEDYKINDEMICSEFVAKSIVASLIETNNILLKELEQAGLPQLSQKIIDIPLEKEKLKRVHPERLFNLLNNTGCLLETASPSLLSILINQDDTSLAPRKIKQRSAGEIFYNKLLSLDTMDSDKYTASAIEAFKSYAQEEKIDLNFKDDNLTSYLESNFKKLHSEICESSSHPGKVIINFLKEMAKWFGIHIKSNAQKSIENTINNLEKIQVQLITDHYRSQASNNLLESTEPSIIPFSMKGP